MEKLRKSISDDELLLQLRQGNQWAFLFLFKYYYDTMEKVIKGYLKHYNKPNMFQDDLFEIATNSFENSIKNYVIGGRSFFNFWKTSMINDFNDFFKKMEKEKIVSFDVSLIDNSYLRLKDVEDAIGYSEQVYNHNEKLIDEIVDNHSDKFSEQELRFLFLLKYGYKIEQIMTILSINQTKAYRLKCEIQEKLNKIMKHY